MRERHSELPCSPEAEEAVVGGLMLREEAFGWADGLAPDDFHDPFFRAAFSAAVGLAGRSQSVDVLSVHEAMRSADSAVGQEHLQRLGQATQWSVTPRQFRAYVDTVRNHARLRALALVGWDIVELGHTREDAAKQVDAAQMLLAKLSVVKARQEPRLIEHSMGEYLDLLDALSQGSNPALATGIGGLDRILNGGLRRGEVFVLGARPKHGKTALALTMARGLARRYWTLFLSQEMPVAQLMHRHTAAMGSVDIGSILRADPEDQSMWSGVLDAAQRLRSLKLYHDDQCALTLLDVRRKAMKVRQASGLDVLMVDFLQLMAGAGEENRNRELDVLVNGLKALAMDLQCAVVVLSQMSRKADEHYGPPTMTHLRDSGAIEAAADQIGLLFTDHAHPLSPKAPQFAGFSQLDIVAHRNGPTGMVPLEFVGRFQQVGDWTGEIPRRRQALAGRTGGADL